MSSQTKLIKDILSIYKTILENKSLSEAPNASDELLGGDNVIIPSDGAHAGQSGWQSGNAWDIKGNVGAPVYALASGIAETFHDYGQNITKTQGKKLYGQSFTVKSNDDLPSIYYTHLEGSPITKGSEIKCGQFLGYIMDFPGSNYDHVHIGVERGNIRQFLNTDGTLKCAKGQKISGDNVSNSKTSSGTTSSTSSTFNGETKPDELIMQFANAAANSLTKPGSVEKYLDSLGLKEEKLYGKFGDDVQSRYGSMIIPKDTNSKIKSPVSGTVMFGSHSRDCRNRILIKHQIDSEIYYLEYCNITNPSVRNNSSISKGDIIGNTDSDVEVSLYDESNEKEHINSYVNKEINTKETKFKPSGNRDDETVISKLLQLPFKPFKNVKDKEGKIIKKRWASPTEKEQPEPWIKKLSPTYNPEKQDKKLTENIDRIKGLLK